MNLSKHCALCDNQKLDLITGTTCGLTDRKPAFHKTCSKIELNEKFENTLKNINVEYQKIKRKKILIYIYFLFFLIVGIAVMIFGYLLGKYALKKSVFSTIPIIIMMVGLTLIGMAIGSLNKHLNDLKIAKDKKDKLDLILNQYQITYDIEIKFGKEVHGTQEVYVELNTKGIR
jgi:hypothetical protein